MPASGPSAPCSLSASLPSGLDRVFGLRPAAGLRSGPRTVNAAENTSSDPSRSSASRVDDRRCGDAVRYSKRPIRTFSPASSPPEPAVRPERLAALRPGAPCSPVTSSASLPITLGVPRNVPVSLKISKEVPGSRISAASASAAARLCAVVHGADHLAGLDHDRAHGLVSGWRSARGRADGSVSARPKSGRAGMSRGSPAGRGAQTG